MFTTVIPADFLSQTSFTPRFPNLSAGSSAIYGLDIRNLTDFTDSIASVTASVTGLTVTYTGNAGTSYPSNLMALIAVSGGTSGSDYDIVFTVTTTKGSIFNINVWVAIEQLGNFIDPTSTLILNTIGEGPIEVTGGGPIESNNIVAVSMSPSGVSAGTYSVVTVDAYGRVVAARGITLQDIQGALGYTPANATAPAVGRSDASPNYVVQRDPQGNFSANQITASLAGNAQTATRLAQPQSISLAGDVTGSVATDFSGAVSINVALAPKGSYGTYTKVTTDSVGRVISGSNISSGDVVQALGFQPLPTLTAGTATSLPSNSPPTVTINTVGGVSTLSVGIPAGLQGANAIAPNPYTIIGNWNASTNTPALSNGGSGGTANQGFMVSVAGSTSLDGISSWNVGDTVLCNSAGTAWVRVSAPTNSGTVSLLQLPSTVTPSFQLYDDSYADGARIFADAYGNAGLKIDATGVTVKTLNVTGGITGVSFGVSTTGFSIPSALSITSDGYSDGAKIWLDQYGNVAMRLDSSGLTVNTLNCNVLNAGGTTSNTFTSTDIAQRNATALDHSLRIRGRNNNTAQQATKNYNLVFSYGQSKSIGQEGSPALSTTQPYDNVMYGQSTRPQNFVQYGTNPTQFNPLVDSNFHPLVSTNQNPSGTTVATLRTGGFASLQGVTVNAGTLTISWVSGGDATTVFAVNDTFQMQGFTVATNNNFSGQRVYTVTAVTTNSITVASGTPALQSTVSPENNIGIYQTNYTFGEDSLVTATNELRAAQLAQARLDADSSRLLVASNAGVSGQPISALASTYYPRVDSAFGQIKTAANALGKTSALSAVIYNQGGNDAGSGTTKEVYSASLTAMVDSVTASAATQFGQTKAPFWFNNIVCGGELTDFDTSGTEYCPVTMAQLEVCGLAPYNGKSTPYSPNMYLVGPDYATTDHGNAHLTGNGYVWTGGQYGKVMQRVMVYGQGWQPLHCITAEYRGSQVLLSFHVPEPPLQIAWPYKSQTPTFYSDLGFCVYDASGQVGINSVTVGETTILINCSRTISGAAPNVTGPIVKYADAALHAGMGNICDSDVWVPHAVQTFTAGSGQLLGENLTATQSLTNLSQNGKPFPSYNFLCPFVATCTAA